LEQTQSDLQLAFKRISDLQATIEDEIIRDSDEEYSDDRCVTSLTMNRIDMFHSQRKSGFN